MHWSNSYFLSTISGTEIYRWKRTRSLPSGATQSIIVTQLRKALWEHKGKLLSSAKQDKKDLPEETTFEVIPEWGVQPTDKRIPAITDRGKHMARAQKHKTSMRCWGNYKYISLIFAQVHSGEKVVDEIEKANVREWMALGIMLWDMNLILWGLKTSHEIFKSRVTEKRCFIKITGLSMEGRSRLVETRQGPTERQWEWEAIVNCRRDIIKRLIIVHMQLE